VATQTEAGTPPREITALAQRRVNSPFLASEGSPPPSATDTLASEQAERQREEINAL